MQTAATMDTMDLTPTEQRHWQRNKRLTAALLVLWFVVSFVVTYHARSLSFTLFGWPFSFWMAAQGSLLVYCWIVWYYARRMARLDAEHGVQENGA